MTRKLNPTLFLFLNLWLLSLGALTVIAFCVALITLDVNAPWNGSVGTSMVAALGCITSISLRTIRIERMRANRSTTRLLVKSDEICLAATMLLWLGSVISGFVITVKANAVAIESCGSGCKLHNSLVWISLLMLFGAASLYCLNSTCGKNNVVSLFHFRPILEVSEMTSHFSSTRTLVEDEEKLIQTPISPEQKQYLQRGNSLSTQKAIYPGNSSCNTPRYQNGRRLRTPARLLSLSETSTLGFTDIESTYSRTSRSSYPETRSSPSRTMSMRSKWSFVEPLPPLPEQYQSENLQRPRTRGKQAKSSVARPRELSPPPPSWCPKSFRDSPLSADPAIRALSGRFNEDLHKPILPRVASRTSRVTQRSISQTWSPPAPFILPRAHGHVGKLSDSSRNSLQTDQKDIRKQEDRKENFSASSFSIATNPWVRESH